MKISRKWKRLKPIYRHFGGDSPNLDYSDKAALDAFTCETYGNPKITLGVMNKQEKYNGYFIGKHWMDVTIKQWLQDLGTGILFIDELYSWYPKEWHWWLDKHVKKPWERNR